MNLNLLDYALGSILRRKTKNIFIYLILTLLIFLIAAVLFIAHSMEKELELTYNTMPEIIVQKLQAGRIATIENERVDEILAITGVQSAVPRVWGYYYFKNAGVNFSILGIDIYEEQYKASLSTIVDGLSDELDDGMLVGIGVHETLQANYYQEYFNFILPDGRYKKLPIKGTFDASTQIFSNDTVLLSKDHAREIFGMENNEATDIAVKVLNPLEIPTVAQKITFLYPDSKVITKEDMLVSNKNLFNYKSGLFLSLFTLALFTFFIIIYDKASGLSNEEKKEIGILKAIGWRINDILTIKLYESFLLALFAYLSGIVLALFVVYILNAPLLKDIFIGYSKLKPAFDLHYYFEMETLAMIFFITIPLYVASILIPAWRSATIEADEALR
jgi:ABC-type lipoprotein release transport system permease subunit